MKPPPLIVPEAALVIVPPMTVPVGALVMVPLLVQSGTKFNTPLFAAPTVPFCADRPVIAKVPLLAVRAPVLTARLPSEPKPIIVPAPALVTLPPARLPPRRLTVPVLLQAGTTLSVASDSMLTMPFCTGAVVKLRVPFVAVIAPELTTRLETVPKPARVAAALLVRFLPVV